MQLVDVVWCVCMGGGEIGIVVVDVGVVVQQVDCEFGCECQEQCDQVDCVGCVCVGKQQCCGVECFCEWKCECDGCGQCVGQQLVVGECLVKCGGLVYFCEGVEQYYDGCVGLCVGGEYGIEGYCGFMG